MGADDHVWRALVQPRFLLTSWPWRSLGYLVSTVLVGGAALLALGLLAGVGAVTAVALVGIPLLVMAVLAGIPIGSFERRRLRLLRAGSVPDPHPPVVAPGLWEWVRTRLSETATWRELAYALLLALVLWPLDVVVLAGSGLVSLVPLAAPLLQSATPDGVIALGPVTTGDPVVVWLAVPVGVVGLVVSLYLLTVVAAGQAAVARLLLGKPAAGESAAALSGVVASRARLVDAFEAEQRRIERDLHDGAQQRLVAMTMNLGMALLDLPPGPGREAVAAARDHATQALAELRELIRGVHPVVLAERGLAAAVAEVADRSAVAVDVDIDVPGRFPAQVESAAYFAVCEGLANIDRHSRADAARVRGRVVERVLVIEIVDDGVGGADPQAGSGLVGLADRVAVVEGTLSLSSPAGGPTSLRVEIPCPAG